MKAVDLGEHETPFQEKSGVKEGPIEIFVVGGALSEMFILPLASFRFKFAPIPISVFFFHHSISCCIHNADYIWQQISYICNEP